MGKSSSERSIAGSYTCLHDAPTVLMGLDMVGFYGEIAQSIGPIMR